MRRVIDGRCWSSRRRSTWAHERGPLRRRPRTEEALRHDDEAVGHLHLEHRRLTKGSRISPPGSPDPRGSMHDQDVVRRGFQQGRHHPHPPTVGRAHLETLDVERVVLLLARLWQLLDRDLEHDAAERLGPVAVAYTVEGHDRIAPLSPRSPTTTSIRVSSPEARRVGCPFSPAAAVATAVAVSLSHPPCPGVRTGETRARSARGCRSPRTTRTSPWRPCAFTTRPTCTHSGRGITDPSPLSRRWRACRS